MAMTRKRIGKGHCGAGTIRPRVDMSAVPSRAAYRGLYAIRLT